MDNAGNLSYVRGAPVRAAGRDPDSRRNNRRDDGGSADRPDDDTRGALDDSDSASLPFTGLLLASILAAGLLLLAAGLALRRRLRGRAG